MLYSFLEFTADFHISYKNLSTIPLLHLSHIYSHLSQSSDKASIMMRVLLSPLQIKVLVCCEGILVISTDFCSKSSSPTKYWFYPVDEKWSGFIWYHYFSIWTPDICTIFSASILYHQEQIRRLYINIVFASIIIFKNYPSLFWIDNLDQLLTTWTYPEYFPLSLITSCIASLS